MSDITSDDEDPIDNIDFSVISTAIETGGKTLDQILNAVHYGTPEVRYLLRESCDFIFECKHCKSLFRSIPNFIAHKRIYCGEKAFFPQNTPKKKQKRREEVVIVRPVSPSLAVVDTSSKDGGKTVLEQILTGSFEGNSDAYKLYTEAATNVEKQKVNQSSTIVTTCAIKNTQNAVSVNVMDVPENSHNAIVSNAAEIISKTKMAKKQPLTKIVNSLKKNAKLTSTVSKTVANVSKEESSVSSPRKTADKKTSEKVVSSEEVKDKTVKVGGKSASKSLSPRKSQTKIDTDSGNKLKDKVSTTSTEQKSVKNVSSSTLKPAKVILTPLQSENVPKSDKLPTPMEMSALQNESPVEVAKKAISTSTEKEKPTSMNVGQSAITFEKTQPKLSTDLRPVKTQDGSQLHELSQLGHCDLTELKCLICNLQYSMKKTLLQHMHVIHSGTRKKYPCNLCSPSCNRTFDYFWGLTRHIILFHKKTKEEVDKMRPQLRALAYNVTPDDFEERSSADNQSKKQGNASRHISPPIVKVSLCRGCNKSFWTKTNYEEHIKQCRFLADNLLEQIEKKPKRNKEEDKTKSTTQEDNNKTSTSEVLASRRRRTLEKLRESRGESETRDKNDNSDMDESSNNSCTVEVVKWNDKRPTAASKRPRTSDGKFVSKKVEAKLREQEKKKKDNDEKDNEEKSKINKANLERNKLVKKLKEKSHSYVPAKRFISTRRAAAFYNSPAQRTRFHDKRRAVVSSPNKDTRSPSKSPMKPTSEPSPSPSGAPPAKKSPQQKSELELARRNLINAIEKVKKDHDGPPEKTILPSKKESVSKTPTQKMNSQNANSVSKNVRNSSEKESVERKSRSTNRKQQGTSSKNESNDGIKAPCPKSDIKHTPSRDSSVESFRSRKSTRSNRDTSREHSLESITSRQSTRTQRDTSRDLSIESSSRTNLEDASQKSNEKDVSANRRSVSREMSTESLRSSSKNISSGKKEDHKIARSDGKQSRDSSNESVRTRASDNTNIMKSPSEVLKQNQAVSKVAESQQMGTSRLRTNQISPESAKNLASEVQSTPRTCTRPVSTKSKHINEKENSNENEKQTSPKGKKESPKMAANKKGEKNVINKTDEIDGIKTGGQNEKAKPKWSTKNWSGKKVEVSEKPVTKALRDSSLKVIPSKGKVSKSQTKLKGVTKPKILKGKPRYPTRSLKTRIQAAKKIGELKKRFSTRIAQAGTDTEKGKPVQISPNSKEKSKELLKDKNTRKSTGTSQDSDDKVKSQKVKSQNVDNKIQPEQIEKSEKSQNKTSPNSDKQTKLQETGERVRRLSAGKVEIKEECVGTSDKPKETHVYKHRPRKASDMEGVKVIEEIWVSKELGQPLQNVIVKKTIIDSPKKTKAGRIYVVDSAEPEPEKSKCLDFSRINHLVDYKNNKCLQCGLELTDISSLRRHAVRHLGWKRYKCKLCAYTGFNRSECNSHIKRRHAEKLVTSSAPLSTFIIDLNKEASQVRNKKKQSTLRKKNTLEKKAGKNKGKASGKEGITLRKSVRQNKTEEMITEGNDEKPTESETVETDDVRVLPSRRARENTGPSVSNVSPPTDNIKTEAKLSKKRKRAVSEEGSIAESGVDNSTAGKSSISSSGQMRQRSGSFSEQRTGNDEDFEEELRSMSDYEDNDRENPPRNVVSPTWTKMNPNVALMMATLEEARATKFSRGKKGRGGIRRFSSPLKKHPRLSTDEPEDQDKDEDEDSDEENNADVKIKESSVMSNIQSENLSSQSDSKTTEETPQKSDGKLDKEPESEKYNTDKQSESSECSEPTRNVNSCEDSSKTESIKENPSAKETCDVSMKEDEGQTSSFEETNKHVDSVKSDTESMNIVETKENISSEEESVKNVLDKNCETNTNSGEVDRTTEEVPECSEKKSLEMKEDGSQTPF